MFVAYELLSETARVWIYPASRKFYNEEIEPLKTKIQDFITQWKQDDVDFKCSYQLLYSEMLLNFSS